ncbi:MAG: hypothetical protein ABSB63_09800 [Spirochaetia bacterium]
MRKTMVLSVLLLSFAAGLLWAQFWKDYTDTDRRAVAEAYWLVGKQYETIGQPEVGGSFMAMAKEIYPALDPAAITDQALPSAAELLAQGRTTEIGAAAAGIPMGAVSSFFLRFIGALMDKDPAEIAGFLDGSVYLTRLPAEVTRADAQAAMADFFKDAPLKDLQPSRVYNLDSIVVSRTPQAMQTAWGETYTLTISAVADYSQYVSLWDMTQQFFIRRVSGNWYLFGYGPTPPPLTWTPQKAQAMAQEAPPAAEVADPSSSITHAFTSCLSALLKKDAEGALAFMSQSVHFLRMRQSVTRDELKTTLQGYFDTADFKNAAASDVVDLDSIFVEPSASPVEGVTGDVYMLNVQSRMDLSAGIPFWSGYQRYYWAREAGSWVIFAIL